MLTAYSEKETPALDDEVWCLRGISKGGKSHRRLSSIGIHSVGDLLQYHEGGKRPLNKVRLIQCHHVDHFFSFHSNEKICCADSSSFRQKV